MPLITVTTSAMYYPDETVDIQDLSLLSNHMVTTMQLVRRLSNRFSEMAPKLGIAYIPSEGVQVDIKRFHRHALNAPDIWVHVAFAEVLDTEEDRLKARDTLIRWIDDLLIDSTQQLGLVMPNWALDVFWGPSHGYYQITGMTGLTTNTW